MKNFLKENKLIIIIFAILLVFLWIYTRERWTLMVCKTKMNEVECRDNTYIITGFKNEKECMLEGTEKFTKEGFECGKNCKRKDEINICSKICNAGGCNQ